MSSSYPFTFPLANGLHARPASHLQAVANRFQSNVTLAVRPVNGSVAERSGNAKSVLSLTGLDVQQGEPCVLTATGADEAQAIEILTRFVRDELPHVDDQPQAEGQHAVTVALPRSLKATGIKGYLQGTAVVVGIGRGKALVAEGGRLEVGSAARKAGSAEQEAKPGVVKRRAAKSEWTAQRAALLLAARATLRLLS